MKTIFNRLHRIFNRCHFCHWRKANWHYMPGGEDACDKCVPRGCSCNLEPVDGDYGNNAPENWKELTDQYGRKLPCCEWWPI